ncbi:hypothetical protein TRVL_07739 [Trypanosoma vivax]|uniref:Uncharacterized protein n=1 Tax=Trypanosoma vivax (strain Y486) TaxID=1055687 RepID=G0UBE3_TRYVY|nr:hypothetical protein TRVL_07739 [Trypanosoma vivax]CCC53138.1 hypothetical protein, unlikely [Trypanosoma vivax Y486]
MLFLLFLFLGALGTRAEVMRASCDFKRGRNVNCSIAVCYTAMGDKETGNVTCTCEDHETSKYYTLEFHERGEDECTITALVKTTSCTHGEKNCVEKKFEELQQSKFALRCECGSGVGVQNQGRKGVSVDNQGKKSEGAQNQGKKSEGVQNQVKEAEGGQGRENGNNKEPVPHESTGAQNADQLGEPRSTEKGTGGPSASNRNAEESTQSGKAEKRVSAAARSSQEVAFLHLFLPFIAVMPRIN